MTDVVAATEALPELRSLLLAMRSDLIERMASNGIEPGFLHLLTGVGAGLAALDTVPADAEAAERVVIIDDNQAIELRIYAGAAVIAAVPLAPQRAVHVASELTSAAARRLGR